MNAVEIEEVISPLAELPFHATEFPFAFLQAFSDKETTIKRMREGESNKSDLSGVPSNQQYPYRRRRSRRGYEDACRC
jgi:hypothetical protein